MNLLRTGLVRSSGVCRAWVLTLWVASTLSLAAADGEVSARVEAGMVRLRVLGDADDEWRFEASGDLATWTNASGLGTVYSGGEEARSIEAGPAGGPGEDVRFFRGVRTTGLFDPEVLRTVSLTFTQANWQTLLANARTTGSNVVGNLVMDGGVTIAGVGVRYKGNTSYSMGGTKKSVNIEVDHTQPEARLMGYRTVNLNNAAGDETIMREPLYFNVMHEYAPSPMASLVRLTINGEYWGVYSFAQQENSDLVREWFPSADGDRWSAPNVGGGGGGGGGGLPPGPGGGGGGGGFSSGASALSYLGAGTNSYRLSYFLKTDNSTNAWDRLVHAITVLNNTPMAELRDRVEEVLAVDRWLWFLAVENVFADDDSYWNKGADYGFYYEPESGRLHPIEHDGNEAFTAGDTSLSPVQGSTGTNRPVLSRLLGIPELRQRYLAHMRTILEEKFNPTIMNALIDRFHRLSVAAIMADTKKSYSMAGYTNDLTALRNFVRLRHTFLTNHAELRPERPTIADLTGPAAAPTPAEAAVITARVDGGVDGVDSVWLYHRAGNAGKFTQSRMYDDGAHADGAAGDGVYGGSTTAHPAGTRVRYYVEARAANTAKAARFEPARAEQEPASYRVGTMPTQSSPVLINEFMASNGATIQDPQGEFDDWIELRNVTAEVVDVGGMYLSDNVDNPRKWRIPDGTRIAAGGYLLVWTDEDGGDPGLHANFKLATGGETILLVDTDGRQNGLLDSVTYGAQETDRSSGRSPAGAGGFVSMSPTPGVANRAP